MSFHTLDCFYFVPALAGFGFEDELGKGFVIVLAWLNWSIEFSFELPNKG